ncbi:hypothetical protein BDY17DRAFT_307170 [Neohortaea acidophila]|uniref:RNA polymerase II degradation factor 1 n=1 Tax=Neohortaea acidophila TaxID=245834 RepID=A0A6A6Q6B7_9PEZI|nr:uncharacterized protein BDY17DRAFT_307170 [Neohortaea acidophila]KAF2487832.1 hypothetical protein BDY17DRAFT_307170 [Neohortaea acidophila]
MSQIDARPPPTRGRSSHRGGRGGFGRSSRGGRKPLSDSPNDATSFEDSFGDEGEVGEMKKQYATELPMLRDMFPDWTDVDLVFALQEADGDIPSTVERIAQGNVSQFAEVKSAKDRARSKVKETSVAPGAAEKTPARGGRGRGGFEGTRGSRGRGSERGRGGIRGGRGGHAAVNGSSEEPSTTSVPTVESTSYDDGGHAAAPEVHPGPKAHDAAKGTGDAGQSAWANVVTSQGTPATASEGAKSSLIPEGGAKKSWASMFAQKPAPPAPKKVPTAKQAPAELAAAGVIPAASHQPTEGTGPPPDAPVSLIADDSSAADRLSSTDGAELDITPTKDPLTEENVEHLPDDSHPPATLTVASTAGSADPRNPTPLPGQQAPIARPPIGGYATSAQRAAGLPNRSASFQRRVLEQQEAVVMPGHNAVDRAAVQFGSMGINGEPGPDVDDDREEPETRHAPQHSPPSQPRTSLPPAPRQVPEAIMPEGLPTPKQAPGLPPASQQNQQQIQEVSMAPTGPSEMTQINQNYNQYSQRYGQAALQQDSGAQQAKPYDPYQQGPQSQYDQYGSHVQQPHQQQAGQGSYGGHSSAPSDYSSYYTADHQRGGYSNYYGSSYGPQDARNQGQQDAGMGQQRSASGFGAAGGPHDTAFASQAQQQVSTSQSLLDLNAALNGCSNEGQRRYLLNEIQRIISSVQMQSKPHTAGKPAGGDVSDAGRAPGFAERDRWWYESLFNGPMPPPTQSLVTTLSDVTNLTSPDTPSSPLQTSSKSILSDQPSKQAQSRYGDTTGSGHNTPNPPMASQQQSTGANTQQTQQPSMHQAPSHQQQGGYGAQPGFPYGHQYYSSPYPSAYQSQFGYSGQLGGYGGYPAKPSGMYGASHGYGMGPQSSYEQHSASPANAASYAQNQSGMRSGSGVNSGLGGVDDYGRGSAQSHQQSSAFASMHDPFNQRSGSGYGGAAQQQQSGYGQQSMATGQDDSLKPFSEASKAGSSPALGQPGGRPGSAANSAGGSNQSGLPPPQNQQSGFGGGYPGFAGQGQYGLGGLGSQQQQQQQQQQQGGYGSYGAGSFNQTYGSYNSRGGWGSNYGAH